MKQARSAEFSISIANADDLAKAHLGSSDFPVRAIVE